jgi:hypothetical protein
MIVKSQEKASQVNFVKQERSKLQTNQIQTCQAQLFMKANIQILLGKR